MNISIIAVGRIGNLIEKDLVNRYKYRFDKCSKLLGINSIQIIEVDDKKYRSKTLQAKKIAEILKSDSHIVLFDQKGKGLSSEEFTAFLLKQRDFGVKNLAFIIGGAFGLCSSLHKKSNEAISLGKMVWPHFLVRVMVTEQIYRSASIILGNPYHKN